MHWGTIYKVRVILIFILLVLLIPLAISFLYSDTKIVGVIFVMLSIIVLIVILLGKMFLRELRL